MKKGIDELTLRIEVWKMNFRRRLKVHLQDAARFVLIVLVVLLCAAGLTFCIKSWFEQSPDHTLAMKMQQDHIEGTDLYRIEDSNLYYDQNTRVVYYVIFAQDSVYSKSFGLMSEYYSENLKKCKYIDGQIIEAE